MTSSNEEGVLTNFVNLLGSILQEDYRVDNWEGMIPAQVLDRIRDRADALVGAMTESDLETLIREASDVSTFCKLLADAAANGLGVSEPSDTKAS